MRIATWNLNSIRTRLTRLVAWLEAWKPDVLCLQELKVADGDFPHEAIEKAGYRATCFGQKTYNGVAILTRGAVDDVIRGLGDDDPQARFIHARVDGVRVISAYFPNGQALDSDKYPYKLNWLDRLLAWLEQNARPDEALALCGDFNIATDDRDVAFPERWEGGVLYNDEVRERLSRLRDWGLRDAQRLVDRRGGQYSWWDYRQLAFPKNDGLRIDYVYVTQPLAQAVTEVVIDREQRKESVCAEGTKPSDHAPVIGVFEL
ncbi:MAG: exodeoxyribonuclease III [Planctomycetes bacterium]|nr:exodeoxyribonuclease III [Planctomycetota bacterium]